MQAKPAERVMDNICKNCKHWEGKNKAKFGKCNSKELWKMLGLTNVKSRADTSCKHFTAKEGAEG
jgi:hypothetical protein